MVDSSRLDLQAAEDSAATSAACPLSGLSPETHQFIHSLEARIAKLETEQQQSRERTIAFGKSLYQNPMTKMFLASAPKELQNKIKDFFADSNAVTENSRNGTAR